MKKELDIEKVSISAPNHSGAVELVYFNGYLVLFNSVNITGNFRRWYLSNVPVDLDELKSFAGQYKPKGVTVTYTDITFDEFWEQYNNKINAKRCVPIWNKLGRKKRLIAFYRIWEYEHYITSKGIAKLNPENYLRDERFLDEAW